MEILVKWGKKFPFMLMNIKFNSCCPYIYIFFLSKISVLDLIGQHLNEVLANKYTGFWDEV